MLFYNILKERASEKQRQIIIALLAKFSKSESEFLYYILQRILSEDQKFQESFLALINSSIAEYQDKVGMIRYVPENIINFFCRKNLNYLSQYLTMFLEEVSITERQIYYKFMVLKIRLEKYLSHPINDQRLQIQEISAKLDYSKFQGLPSFEAQLQLILGKQYQLIQNLEDQSNIKQYKFSLQWYQKQEKSNNDVYDNIRNSNFGLKGYRLNLITHNKQHQAAVFSIQQAIFIDELDYILNQLVKYQCKPQNMKLYTELLDNIKDPKWQDTQLDPLLSKCLQLKKCKYFYKYYKIYLNKKNTLTIRQKLYQFLIEVIQESDLCQKNTKQSKFVKDIIAKIQREKNIAYFYKILFSNLSRFIKKKNLLLINQIRKLLEECQRLLVCYFRFRFQIHQLFFMIIVQSNLSKQELVTKILEIFDLIGSTTYQDIQEDYLSLLIKKKKMDLSNISKTEQNYQTLNQLDFTFKYISNSLIDIIILSRSEQGWKQLSFQATVEAELINLTNQDSIIPANYYSQLYKRIKTFVLADYYLSFKEYRERLCQQYNSATKNYFKNSYLLNEAEERRMKYESNLSLLQQAYEKKDNKGEQEYLEYFTVNEKMIDYTNRILDFEIKKSKNKFFQDLLIFCKNQFYNPNKFVLFLSKPLRIVRWIHKTFGILFIRNFERQLYLMIVSGGADIKSDLLLQQYDQGQELEIRKLSLAQQYQVALNVISHFKQMYPLLDFKLALLPTIQNKVFYDQIPSDDDLNSYQYNFCCYIIDLLTNIYAQHCIRTETDFVNYIKVSLQKVEIKEIIIFQEYKSQILQESQNFGDDLLHMISQCTNTLQLCQKVVPFKESNSLLLNNYEKLFKIKQLLQRYSRNIENKTERIQCVKFYHQQIKQQGSFSTILYLLQAPNPDKVLSKFVSGIKKNIFQQMGEPYYDMCPLNIIRLTKFTRKQNPTSFDEINKEVQKVFVNFMNGFLDRIYKSAIASKSGDEINSFQEKVQMKAQDKFTKALQLQDNYIDLEQNYLYQICEQPKIDIQRFDKIQRMEYQIYQNNFQIGLQKADIKFSSISKTDNEQTKNSKCKMNIDLLLYQKHQKQNQKQISDIIILECDNRNLQKTLNEKQEKYKNNLNKREVSLKNVISKPVIEGQVTLKVVQMVLKEDYPQIWKQGKFLKYQYY